MSKIVLIILLAQVVTSCIYLPKEAATETVKVEESYSDFNTLDIRSMWILCSNNFLKLAPQIPPYVYISICDCMIDTIRKTYTKADLQKLTYKEIMEMNKKFVEKCRINVPKPQLQS
jgi:small-conductance mechanosensitive channel